MISLSTDNRYINIFNFLNKNQDLFKPTLSEYVNIKEYCIKLADSAENLFVIDDQKFLAHAAYYINNDDSNLFISSFCVDKHNLKKGLGIYLMQCIKQRMLELNFTSIVLEVFIKNQPAINFYQKQGFLTSNKTNLKLTLQFSKNE